MQQHLDHHPPDRFPTDPSGLPEAGRPALLELADGDTLKLKVGPVAKRLGDTMVRMLGYNGSVPGPTLKVAPRVRDCGPRGQWGGFGDDGALAWVAVGEPL